MASLTEIRQARLEKIKLLKQQGINPYPARVKRDFTIKHLKDNFSELNSSEKLVSIAGRIMIIRGQGAILFAVLFDGTEKVQAIFKKDEMSEEKFKFFQDVFDMGDFISVTGNVILSKTGEESILVKDFMMAGKSLQPLPEKWHGLQDIDERYRKRYLDFLMNNEIKDLIILKSKFWDNTREFLKANNFLEVETPTLETTTGGAEATPFATHHNDYDLDVYLRISIGELWQKRLMAGGFSRTFEIGRAYRNEGSSPEHLQEFTNLEFYASFMDYNEGIEFTEKMIKEVVFKTFGKMDFETRGHSFSLEGSWPRVSYCQIVKEKTGIDVLSASKEEMEEKLKELNVKYDGNNKERLTDTLWKYCRKQITGPIWLVDQPKIISALAKSKESDPNLTERVQLVLAGAELTNGYSELNDPIDQEDRFNVQQELLNAGDSEAMMPDMEFVEMLEHGMPPTFGFGMGERFFAFLVDKPLRELQVFPLMSPKSLQSKDKDMYVINVLINKESNLEMWQIMNTVAHLSASFAARTRKKLFKYDHIKTEDDVDIKLNIQHAIMLKKADSTEELKNIEQLARKNTLEIAHFTREMIETTNDNKVASITKEKKYKEIDLLGLLIFGKKSIVDEITKNIPLM